jgi:lipopolysaccharide assembly protein A
MAYLIWVVRILLFVMLFGLAARNMDMVHVRGYLGYEWQAPLALALLAATFVGVLLGVLGAVRMMLYLRKISDDSRPAHSSSSPEIPLNTEDSASFLVKRTPVSYRKAGESLAGEEGA